MLSIEVRVIALFPGSFASALFVVVVGLTFAFRGVAVKTLFIAVEVVITGGTFGATRSWAGVFTEFAFFGGLYIIFTVAVLGNGYFDEVNSIIRFQRKNKDR